MGFFAGLISMLGWGIADFFAAKSSRSIGALKTLFFAQLIGFVIIGSYFIFAGELPEIGFREITIALFLSFIYVVSFVFFYKSLEIGPVSIVSPVAASWNGGCYSVSFISK